MTYVVLLMILMLALALVLGGLFLSRQLAPRDPYPGQSQAYECGESPIGSGWVRFHAGYYLVALLFLVFDVEAAFLFPWAVVQRMAGIAGLVEITLFISILMLALVYAWKRGALKWL